MRRFLSSDPYYTIYIIFFQGHHLRLYDILLFTFLIPACHETRNAHRWCWLVWYLYAQTCVTSSKFHMSPSDFPFPIDTRTFRIKRVSKNPDISGFLCFAGPRCFRAGDRRCWVTMSTR